MAAKQAPSPLQKTRAFREWLRSKKSFPHVWCPGCGLGIVLAATIRAVGDVGYGKDETVMVSGIGCTGRIPAYVDCNTLHTTHGRALTFATGVKLAKPELKVMVLLPSFRADRGTGTSS